MCPLQSLSPDKLLPAATVVNKSFQLTPNSSGSSSIDPCALLDGNLQHQAQKWLALLNDHQQRPDPNQLQIFLRKLNQARFNRPQVVDFSGPSPIVIESQSRLLSSLTSGLAVPLAYPAYATIDKKQLQPFLFPTLQRQYGSIAKWIIQQTSTDLDFKNPDGLTPLMVSVASEDIETTQLLLQCRARTDLPKGCDSTNTKQTGYQTALDIAIAHQPPNIKLIKMLLEANADANGVASSSKASDNTVHLYYDCSRPMNRAWDWSLYQAQAKTSGVTTASLFEQDQEFQKFLNQDSRPHFYRPIQRAIDQRSLAAVQLLVEHLALIETWPEDAGVIAHSKIFMTSLQRSVRQTAVTCHENSEEANIALYIWRQLDSDQQRREVNHNDAELLPLIAARGWSVLLEEQLSLLDLSGFENESVVGADLNTSEPKKSDFKKTTFTDFYHCLLSAACEHGQWSVVLSLLARWQDKNPPGLWLNHLYPMSGANGQELRSPLMQAAMRGDRAGGSVIKALLALGADPRLANKAGHTALMYAFCYNHEPDNARELLSALQTLNEKNDYPAYRPEQLVTKRSVVLANLLKNAALPLRAISIEKFSANTEDSENLSMNLFEVAARRGMKSLLILCFEQILSWEQQQHFSPHTSTAFLDKLAHDCDVLSVTSVNAFLNSLTDDQLSMMNHANPTSSSLIPPSTHEGEDGLSDYHLGQYRLGQHHLFHYALMSGDVDTVEWLSVFIKQHILKLKASSLKSTLNFSLALFVVRYKLMQLERLPSLMWLWYAHKFVDRSVIPKEMFSDSPRTITAKNDNTSAQRIFADFLKHLKLPALASNLQYQMHKQGLQAKDIQAHFYVLKNVVPKLMRLIIELSQFAEHDELHQPQFQLKHAVQDPHGVQEDKLELDADQDLSELNETTPTMTRSLSFEVATLTPSRDKWVNAFVNDVELIELAGSANFNADHQDNYKLLNAIWEILIFDNNRQYLETVYHPPLPEMAKDLKLLKQKFNRVIKAVPVQNLLFKDEFTFSNDRLPLGFDFKQRYLRYLAHLLQPKTLGEVAATDDFAAIAI